ncbi:hypothetical protein EB796_007027 [Bugula neritina]|uniref:Uncharacterized protein n=1 Tax=Bugula neritina TaxID=10212 RepID=A0A7J7K8Y1_BUGNE|nr:hypothetical protein EB796_007027 [Bugula neritina]
MGRTRCSYSVHSCSCLYSFAFALICIGFDSLQNKSLSQKAAFKSLQEWQVCQSFCHNDATCFLATHFVS